MAWPMKSNTVYYAWQSLNGATITSITTEFEASNRTKRKNKATVKMIMNYKTKPNNQSDDQQTGVMRTWI